MARESARAGDDSASVRSILICVWREGRDGEGLMLVYSPWSQWVKMADASTGGVGMCFETEG